MKQAAINHLLDKKKPYIKEASTSIVCTVHVVIKSTRYWKSRIMLGSAIKSLQTLEYLQLLTVCIIHIYCTLH